MKFFPHFLLRRIFKAVTKKVEAFFARFFLCLFLKIKLSKLNDAVTSPFRQ